MKVTEERARSYGEVLTPEWVVEQMLEPVKDEVSDCSKVVVDLCCGPGAFISHVLQMRLDSMEEVTSDALLDAVLTLYGVELLEDNIRSCRQRLLSQISATAARLPVEQQSSVLARVEEVLVQNLVQGDALVDELQVTKWGEDGWPTDVVALGELDIAVLVSNPPYQKNISGSTVDSRLRNHSKATPIYNKFYDLARSLQPAFICFIMPAKWYTGGWGLDAWRMSVLSEGRVTRLVDYRDSNFIFPNTEVNGGVCWLLWERDADASAGAHITRFDRQGQLLEDSVRPLLEPGADFFVRDDRSLSILRKVQSFELGSDQRFSSMVLGTTPFGINSNFKGYSEVEDEVHSVGLFYIKKKVYWVSPDMVTSNQERVDEWKVFLSLSHNQHSSQKIGTPHVFGPGVVCSHSYVAVVGFADEQEARNCVTYMQSKFFRFLVGQLKISPIATRNVYRLIPVQDWSKAWSDAELYAQYGLNTEEIEHIESSITPM